MNSSLVRRVTAVSAIVVALPLAGVGLRGLAQAHRGGRSETKATAAETAGPRRPEIHVASGTGAAIQQAIAALPPEGGRVVLGEGTFVIHEPLVIDRDDVELSGDQERTVLRLAERSNAPLLVIGSLQTPVHRRVSGITVRKLTLDGNRGAQDHECNGGDCDRGGLSHIRNNALTIRGAEDVRVQHVTARRARSGGMVLEKECRRIHVSDFTAHDNHFDGLAAYETEESFFTRLYLHDNAAAGISADIRFHRNIIAHARLERNGSQGIFMRDSSFNNFTGLTVRDNGAQGIFIAQADDAQHTSCTGNVFSNLVVTGSRRAGLRVNDASCVANTLADSQFTGNGEGGVSEVAERLLAMVRVEDAGAPQAALEVPMTPDGLQ